MTGLPLAADIVALSARDLSRAIHARAVSCVEVMTAYLDRIDAVNPQVNALVSLPRARRAPRRGRARATPISWPGSDRGWLHGMPQAPKDLTATADIPTTMGSPILAGTPAPADSILVERTRKAGAILIGKTNIARVRPRLAHLQPGVRHRRSTPGTGASSAGGSSGGGGGRARHCACCPSPTAAT